MNRNITIQHNHADKLREGQDMNKKENHSVKSEIEQALLRLMTQKSYLDITVTDIVQEAKVARVSFYRNFASISEAGQYRRCNCRKTEYRIPAVAGYNR